MPQDESSKHIRTNIKYTGDPFVDLGAAVIETLRQETLEEKIRFITNVYVDHWKGKIHSVFLNSKITIGHNKNKPEIQKKEILEYYLGLLKKEESHEAYLENGYCRICSGKGPLFTGGRNNFPMIGSADFTNFYHFKESFIPICNHCLIKTYFMPFGLIQGRNLIFLQIQDKYARKLWQEDYITENLDKVAKGTSEGIMKTNYSNHKNALFKFASEMIEKFKMYDPETSSKIRLFIFTNFAAAPNIEILDLPDNVFLFLKNMLRNNDIKQDWYHLVRRYYWFSKKNFRFDQANGEWFENKKDTETKLDIEEYAGTRTNTIYDRLVSGKSILRQLKDTYKKRNLHPHIPIRYLKEVRKMKQEQIDLIKKLARKIIELSVKESNYKKYITPIQGAGNGYKLRKAILSLSKKYLANEEKEPFISSEEYITYLFPEGGRWDEARDFLLICLYEKLHEMKIDPSEIELSEENSEDRTENQTNLF